MKSFFAPLLLAGVLVAAPAGIIADIRAAIAHNNLVLGEQIVRDYRSQHGVTPELVEAYSWLARGALGARQLGQAAAYAAETRKIALQELNSRPLDAERHLPIALGASIEVDAQVLAERGQRSEAIQFLRGELKTYATTSIATRIQKNINLLSLEGKLAPPLDLRQYLGPQPKPLAALKGKPVLLFFWAHWCGDCRADAPIIARLNTEYSPKGLVVVAPTQFYGYVAGGQEAPPDVELKYIETVRQKYYADLLDVPAPLSEVNFKNYGSSTTPTVVLIDRRGLVSLYRPGAMTYQDLREHIEAVIAAAAP